MAYRNGPPYLSAVECPLVASMSLHFFMDHHTRTAVARLPLRQPGFLVLTHMTVLLGTESNTVVTDAKLHDPRLALAVSRKTGGRISGSCSEGLRWSGSRPAPLQWRRRELALDTSQGYHPCVVCATAIISQSSSLLPRRPTARAKHRQTDADIETEKEADTQTEQKTEAACMSVRCALCVRARHA